MQNRTLSERLVHFIERVRKTRNAGSGVLKVLDLRLECRDERLAEEADWPITELDLIEQEATGYGNETELAKLLLGEVQPQPIQANCWIDSPSPFAWT